MPPNTISEDEDIMSDKKMNVDKSKQPEKQRIAFIMVAYFIYITLAGLYGLYLTITVASWKTIVFTTILTFASCLGITAGAHRLWTHKSYKARLPLQIFLMVCHSTSNTHTTIKWVRDHLLHHKYTDTDADPHNATRGFFYSHIGYLLLTKTAECKKKGKTIDLTELYANPVLQFQQKHCIWFISLLAFIIPTVLPLLWTETFKTAFHINLFRVLLVTNASLTVNSFAHKYGTKPYDNSIKPVQNKYISLLTLGEGFHNYHHVFPNDYRTAELGDNYMNVTTKFIDFCVWIGLAHDCIFISDDVVKARMIRTGGKM